MKTLKETTILNTKITNASKEDILECVFDSLENSSEKLKIFTPNPEILTYAATHESFRNTLNDAQINLADGIGVVLAAQFMRKPSVERISGVDFMEMLCKESVRKTVTTGFLGGRGQVALKAAKCLQVAYPGLRISFVGEEWEKGEWIPREFQENVAGYEDIKKIEKNMLTPRLHLPAEQEIGILFVAYGFPKQEQWITDHIDSLPFRVGMGVGGAFDYFSGTVSRAPKLIQRIGFEWLYRLARQPWRVKRQVALLDFIRLAIAERSLHSS